MAAIGNPKGASVSGGTLDETATGSREVRPFLTDEAVTAGQLLAFTATDTDTFPPVHPADTSNDDPAVSRIVAVEDAAADSVVMACTKGPCLVNIGTDTVGSGQRATATTTAGEAVGAASDATTVEGDSFGTFLGGEIGTTNQAIVYVD